MCKAKPFIKWVGGKGQLLGQLERLLPADFDTWENVTYIEPFVGGGAMFFYMLQTHPNITKAVINDINHELIDCYIVVKNHPQELVYVLRKVQEEYYSLKTEDTKRNFFTEKRKLFNEKLMPSIDNAALFIFLNKTCFNGLYRVNKKGLFNVPYGKYLNPTICDEQTIYYASEILQQAVILNGDFEQTFSEVGEKTFFYFDPPYRPLSETSSFKDYCKEVFDDEAQIRLKSFCDKIHRSGHHFMLSNSDCLSKGADRFFDDLYCNYCIERIWASRSVNSNPSKRGKLTEILVHNYELTKNNLQNLFNTVP